jgi:ClpX C4-type zinc finger
VTSDSEYDKLFEDTVTRIWPDLALSGRNSDLLTSAYEHYSKFADAGDFEKADICIDVLKMACERLKQDTPSKGKEFRFGTLGQNSVVLCSFCSRSSDEVRLAAGPNVFICEHCVKDIQSSFDDKK